MVAAKAGRMLNLEGQPDREGPVYSALHTGSWHASQAAVRGIIGALRVRDLYGRGQWVQTSIVQALASPHDNNVGDGGLVNMQLRRRDPERFPGRPGGSRGLSSIGYVPVRTKDGTWLQHANQRVPHIQGHLKAIGLGHLLADERFEKVPAIDLENRELLRREILNKQLEKTADEWMEIYLQDGNIAAEPYRDSVQAMDHPAVVSNGTVVTINDPRVGPMRTLAPLVDFKDTPGEPSGPAPDVGQHNAEVLGPLRQPSVAVSGGLPEANGADVATHPLSGVTILDLATVQAGPYGAALLADLGARVIKIDATDRRLDEGRRSTAQAVADPRTYAGKEGIQVDLQTPEGKEIVHKLIARADVLSHNFRLGVPERLQIDWETCLKINPRLVHVWMGTYGEHGYTRARPGAHPIPGAIMGGAMRQMGRGMPPSPEQIIDVEETVEATRWLMKSNWGPDQTRPRLWPRVSCWAFWRETSAVKDSPSISPCSTPMPGLMPMSITTTQTAFPLPCPTNNFMAFMPLYRLYRCRKGGCSWVVCSRTSGKHSAALCNGQNSWPIDAFPLQRRDRPMTKP